MLRPIQLIPPIQPTTPRRLVSVSSEGSHHGSPLRQAAFGAIYKLNLRVVDPSQPTASPTPSSYMSAVVDIFGTAFSLADRGSDAGRVTVHTDRHPMFTALSQYVFEHLTGSDYKFGFFSNPEALGYGDTYILTNQTDTDLDQFGRTHTSTAFNRYAQQGQPLYFDWNVATQTFDVRSKLGETA